MISPLNTLKKFGKTQLKAHTATDAAAPQHTDAISTLPVSDGNPCPFLRSLVGAGMIDNGVVPINHLLNAIETVVAHRDQGSPNVPRSGLRAVALTANGTSPKQIANNLRHGVNIDKLREGPYYKHGVHSRTLAETGEVNQDQVLRLSSFGSAKIDKDGKIELGLNETEINHLICANFLRGAYPGHHRSITDIPIMKSEYPVLLQV